MRIKKLNKIFIVLFFVMFALVIISHPVLADIPIPEPISETPSDYYLVRPITIIVSVPFVLLVLFAFIESIKRILKKILEKKDEDKEKIERLKRSISRLELCKLISFFLWLPCSWFVLFTADEIYFMEYTAFLTFVATVILTIIFAIIIFIKNMRKTSFSVYLLCFSLVAIPLIIFFITGPHPFIHTVIKDFPSGIVDYLNSLF